MTSLTIKKITLSILISGTLYQASSAMEHKGLHANSMEFVPMARSITGTPRPQSSIFSKSQHFSLINYLKADLAKNPPSLETPGKTLADYKSTLQRISFIKPLDSNQLTIAHRIVTNILHHKEFTFQAEQILCAIICSTQSTPKIKGDCYYNLMTLEEAGDNVLEKKIYYINQAISHDPARICYYKWLGSLPELSLQERTFHLEKALDILGNKGSNKDKVPLLLALGKLNHRDEKYTQWYKQALDLIGNKNSKLKDKALMGATYHTMIAYLKEQVADKDSSLGKHRRNLDDCIRAIDSFFSNDPQDRELLNITYNVASSLRHHPDFISQARYILTRLTASPMRSIFYANGYRDLAKIEAKTSNDLTQIIRLMQKAINHNPQCTKNYKWLEKLSKHNGSIYINKSLGLLYTESEWTLNLQHALSKSGDQIDVTEKANALITLGNLNYKDKSYPKKNYYQQALNLLRRTQEDQLKARAFIGSKYDSIMDLLNGSPGILSKHNLTLTQCINVFHNILLERAIGTTQLNTAYELATELRHLPDYVPHATHIFNFILSSPKVPKSILSNSYRGLAKIEDRGNKDLQKTIQLMEKAINISPKYIDNYIWLGKLPTLDKERRLVNLKQAYKLLNTHQPLQEVEISIAFGNLQYTDQTHPTSSLWYKQALSILNEQKDCEKLRNRVLLNLTKAQGNENRSYSLEG